MMVEIHSRSLYEEILKVANELRLVGNYGLETEAVVNTKYKIVMKKVKPVASQLPPDSEDNIKTTKAKPGLRETRKIGHKFTEETLAKLKIGGGEFLKEPEKKWL